MLLLPGHSPPPMKTKYVLPQRRTSPLIWLVAVLCTVIAIAVIVAGIIVFVGYIVIRPKVPFISVIYTHLDVFDYDQAGLLTTQVTVQTKWENDNAHAHASFYGAGFVLSLHGMEIAKLVADPFDVSKNSSVELGYTVASSSIPLNPELMTLVDMSLKRDLVTFELRGNARTQWRVGILGSVKFWLHLNCQLHFTMSTMNGSSTHCSTKSK